MDFDQFTLLIQTQELDRAGYEQTNLVVRGADMPGPDGTADWGVTIEGAAGSSNAIAAQVLASVAELEGQTDHPPPFELNDSRGFTAGEPMGQNGTLEARSWVSGGKTSTSRRPGYQ